MHHDKTSQCILRMNWAYHSWNYHIQSNPYVPLIILSWSNKRPRKVGELVHIQSSIVPTISIKFTVTHWLIGCPSWKFPHHPSRPVSCHPVNYPSQPDHYVDHLVDFTIDFSTSQNLNRMSLEDLELCWTILTIGSNSIGPLKSPKYISNKMNFLGNIL